MAVCLLVRHGHSTANADGVLAGWTPGVALTDRGRAQADHLAALLAPLSPVRLVSSPLRRCLETAAPLAAATGLDLDEHDGLGECRYGTWTGRPLKELAEDPLWRAVQDDPAVARFPGSAAYAGEALHEMATRLAGTISEIDDKVTRDHGDSAIWVAFSHGDPIKSVLADALGAGLAGLQRVHVDPGSVSVLHRAQGRPRVLAVNVGPDLGDLLRAARAPQPGAAGDALVGGGTG